MTNWRALGQTPCAGCGSLALAAGQHPAKGAPTDYMQVEMIDLLPAMRARIGDHAETLAISASRNAAFRADPPCGADEIHDLLITGFGGEMLEIDIVPFRDHQNVHGRLRLDVLEGEAMRGLGHRIVRDLAPEDTGKDVLFVIAVLAGHFSPFECIRPGAAGWL